MELPPALLPDAPTWFCLRSQIKHEHIAAAHLRKMEDVEVLCPRVRYQRATRQGPAWVTESLFPNYLFARFNPIGLLNAVRYAHGVSHIVSFGGKYCALPDRVIEDLRGYLGHEDVRLLPAELHEGDEVELARGSLVGLKAVITRVMPGKERVRVLLDFLGRMTEFEIGMADVVPIAASGT